MSTSSTEFLALEYQAVLARLQRLEERLLVWGVGGLLVSAGAAAYALDHRAALNLAVAWAAPAPFVVSAALLLTLLYQRLRVNLHLSELRAAAVGEMPAPTAPQPDPLYLRLLILPGAAAGLLYAFTLFFGLRTIQGSSHAAALIFGLMYALFSAALLLAWVSIARQARGEPAISPGAVRRALLPYPAQFLLGFGLFAAGFLLPLLTTGLNISQLPVLDELFRRTPSASAAATAAGGAPLTPAAGVPAAAVAALGLLVLIVFEGLLVPAGGLWQRRRRGETGIGYRQIVLRFILALPLAYLLGGLPLFILAALITVQLAFSALWINPARPGRGGLLWGALLPALRLTAGVLVWVGPAWSFTFLLLIFCFTAFLALGISAARRARAARIQAVRGEETIKFDFKSAPLWQHAGFLAAMLTALLLLILQVLAEHCGFFDALLAAGYGFCKNDSVHYAQAGLVNGLLLVFDLLVFGLLASAGLVRLLRRPGRLLSLVLIEISPAPPLIGLGAALILTLAALAVPGAGLLSGALLAGALGAAAWYER